jgi:hypothetical protein
MAKSSLLAVLFLVCRVLSPMPTCPYAGMPIREINHFVVGLSTLFEIKPEPFNARGPRCAVAKRGYVAPSGIISYLHHIICLRRQVLWLEATELQT